MRMVRFVPLGVIAALAACSVVNKVDDPQPATKDDGNGTPVGCPEGFELCDNACVRTLNDPSHCGACGQTCGDGEVCGLSQCLSDCPDGLTSCGGSCVALDSELAHCGACDNACTAGANAEATCVAGECGRTCAAGFDDCDADPSDCETNIDGDTGNCGACGNVCVAYANAAPACNAGMCGLGACQTNFDNCDGFAETGCETAVRFNAAHCGQCGNACTDGGCNDGTCVDYYWEPGVQEDLPVATLTSNGWTQCFVETFDLASTPVATMLSQCSGSQLLIGCRPTGAATLQIAAMAPRADVLTDCANGAANCGGASNCTHDANGVGWYFHDSWSIGFVPEGEPLNRCSCDTETSQADLRMCWHTNGGNIASGYRCGNNFPGATYERVVFHIP